MSRAEPTSAAGAGGAAVPARTGRTRSGWLSQPHENARLIDWLSRRAWVIALTPARRRAALALGALAAGYLYVLGARAPWSAYRDHTALWVPSLVFLLLMAFIYGLFRAAVHYRELPAFVQQRPQVSLHAVFWLLLIAAWTLPAAGEAAEAVLLMAVVFPYLLWRCGYMLMSGQRGKAAGTRFRDHLFYIWPVWGSTNTPLGKGHDYLTQTEARTPDAYAKSLLAGINLLLLALLWRICMEIIGALVHADPWNRLMPYLGDWTLDIPRLKALLSGKRDATLFVIWVSLYLEMIWDVLNLAAHGHFYVGLLRLAGFNVFRNTYKPLLAQTVVEFWNRYYYYFKELLTQFFFLPTYLRSNGKPRAMRIVMSIFAAAFVGNLYYHLIQSPLLLAADGAALVQRFVPNAIYCFLLATGIAVSMLREQAHRGAATRQGATAAVHRVRRIAGVWTFFALVSFWNNTADVTLAERARFFLELFGA